MLAYLLFIISFLILVFISEIKVSQGFKEGEYGLMVMILIFLNSEAIYNNACFDACVVSNNSEPVIWVVLSIFFPQLLDLWTL